jgi:hypothetical protein
MGALRQPRPAEPVRKQPVSEKLDKYGRDPNSLAEKLRNRTDYATGEGWAPFPHAVLADLPRLSSGAICTTFVLVCNMLSLGRPRKSGQPWHEWTEPISKSDLAELCSCDEKGIQRQISELSERKMIEVESIRNGTGAKYRIRLLYSTWQGLDDYAVWKRKQVVAIDEALEDTAAEDEAAPAVSSEAVQVFKSPAIVKRGRASKVKKLPTSVNAFIFQNDSNLDASCSAVIQSGCLVVSAKLSKGETEAKGENKANASGHGCPEGFASSSPLPANGGSKNPIPRHPRADEIVKLFDPLLQASGSLLLSFDPKALQLACAELGNMPQDVLLHLVMREGGRGSRSITSPRVVASIVKECRENWERSGHLPAVKGSMVPKKQSFAESVKAEAQRRLNKNGEV